MPNDVKAYVSAAVAVVAIILAYWSGSPVRPEFGNFVLATAAFMIVAMWIFPGAGGKKVSVERKLLAKIPVLKARHYCCGAECPLLALCEQTSQAAKRSLTE